MKDARMRVSWLKVIDDELMRSGPDGLRLVGSRQRTLVTRFGDVVVSRRMYRDSNAVQCSLLTSTWDGSLDSRRVCR